MLEKLKLPINHSLSETLNFNIDWGIYGLSVNMQPKDISLPKQSACENWKQDGSGSYL